MIGHLARDPRPWTIAELSPQGAGNRLAGNLGVEREPKATMPTARTTTVASGTRNPTALAFHPETGELWAVMQDL